MNWTHKEKIEIIKFMSNHPFEEMLLSNNDYDVSQIIGVDYSLQEVLLRDFVWYSIEEIMAFNGFRDKDINNKWNLFLENLHVENECKRCGYFENRIEGKRLKVFECGMCQQQKSPS